MRPASRCRKSLRRTSTTGSCSSRISARATFSGADGEPIAERYEAAAELLADLHRRRWPSQAEAAPGVIHVIPPFDRAAMMIEAELLLDWYVPAMAGRAARPQPSATASAEVWNAALDRIVRHRNEPYAARHPGAELHLARRAERSRPARPDRFPGRADRPVSLRCCVAGDGRPGHRSPWRSKSARSRPMSAPGKAPALRPRGVRGGLCGDGGAAQFQDSWHLRAARPPRW